jgi:predicted Abi (CAAX) family protease
MRFSQALVALSFVFVSGCIKKQGAQVKSNGSADLFKPVAEWSGRLILPNPRLPGGAVYFEVHNAPAAHVGLIGQKKMLRMSPKEEVQGWVQFVTRKIEFTAMTIHPFLTPCEAGILVL